MEDVLKHGQRHQWHIFLEIFEVDDKGLEQTVKMKLRMGATPPRFPDASCSTDPVPVAPEALCAGGETAQEGQEL